MPFSTRTGNFTLWLTFPWVSTLQFSCSTSPEHPVSHTGSRQSKKDFRKSAQFRSRRQALHHLSDWKGLVILHLEQRLLSPGISSQVLGVLFAPGSCACQSLWPRLLPGLSVWGQLLPVPLNYKFSWCIEVYTLQFVPYLRPNSTLWVYAFKCLLLKVGSILSQLHCTASDFGCTCLILAQCLLLAFPGKSLGFWTHSTTLASGSYRNSWKKTNGYSCFTPYL